MQSLRSLAAACRRSWLALGLTAGACVGLAPGVNAATFTWSGNGADNNWTTGANWAGTAPGSGQALVFAGSTRLTPNNDNATFTVTSITFNNTAGAFVIGGNAFTVSGGITNNDANLQTINNTLSISASQSWSAASGGLAFGNINLSTTTTARTLTFTGGNDISVSGTIANGVATTGSITKTGTGTLTLTGANTYSGTTTLTAGTLGVGSNAALGTSTLSLNAGTLTASGAARTLANTVNLAASSTIGGTQDLTLTGALTNTSGANASLTVTNTGYTTLGAVGLSNRILTIAGSGNVSVTGVMSGTGGVTLTNTGTVILTGANTYSGVTTISAGAGTLLAGSDTAFGTGGLTINGGTVGGSGAGLRTLGNAITLGGSATIGGTQDIKFTGLLTQTLASTLTVNNTGTTEFGAINLSNNNTGRTLTFGGTGNVNVIGVIDDGGNTAGNLVQTGTGTLTLTGTNTYTGTTTSTSGTLAIGNNAALGTGALQLNGGALAASGGARSIANAVTFLGATETITGANDLTFTGTLTNAYAGNVALTNNNAGTTTFGAINLSNSATSRTLTIDGTGTTVVNGVIANGGTATASSLIKAGTGTLTLAGSNTYGGTTTISAGTVSAASIVVTGGASNLGNATSAVVLGDGANTGTLSYTGSSANYTRGFTVNAGGGTLDVATSGQTLTLATGNVATSGVFTVTGAGDTIVSSAITGSGSLAKTGTGALTLSNASNYAGGTTLSSGTLNINNASAVGSGTITIASGTVDNTTASAITLAGNNSQNWNGSFTFAGTRDLNLGTGSVTLNATPTVTVAAGTLTVGGAISGTGFGITKDGAGTLALSGTNSSYTGATTINGGTLSVTALANGGSNSSIGAATNSAANLVINGGTLVYTGAGSTTDRLFSVGTSGATIDASGSGAVAFNNSGSLDFNGQSGARQLVLTGTGTGSLSAVIGDNGGATTVTKNGTGTWTLDGSASNTASGTTTVNAGTLALAKTGGALAVNGNLVIGDGSGTDTVRLDAANQIKSTAAVTLDAAGAPTLNLNGYSQTLGSIASSNTGSAIQLGSPGGSSALTVGDTTSTTFAGVISGGSNAGLVKQGSGTLTLSGTNTYAGSTSVTAGTLSATNSSALGAAGGAVSVSSAASLVLGGGTNITKSATLTLSGTGTSATIGALHAGGGAGTTSQWTGNISLAGPTTITAANNLLIIGNGSTFANTLNLGSSTVTFHTPSAATVTPTYLPFPSYALDATNIMVNSAISGTGGLQKTGTGTLTLVAGAAGGNTFTGDTVITGGKLIVDANANTPGINSAQIYVGNASASPGTADSVVLQTGQLASTPAANNMIGTWNALTNASSSSLTIYSDGVFKMNNANNGFANLTLQGGHVDGGNVSYNALLTLTGSLTTNASSRTALINNGNLALSANNFALNIATGSTATGVDLQIDSIVQNGVGYTGGSAGTSIVKSGTGTLVFTAANTYSGVTNIASGVLNIRNNAALGQTGLSFADTANGTVVQNGAQLQLQGGITVGAFETLTLNGLGPSTTGALRNVGGSNTYNGYVNLATDSRINADSGTTLTIANTGGVNATIIGAATSGKNLTVGGDGNTTINGGIAGTVAKVTKDGLGTLTLAGSNGYSGATDIQAGVVKVTNDYGLSGTGVTVASGATLQFAQDAGGNNVSVVGVASTINGNGFSSGGAIQNLNGSNSYLGLVTLGSASLITANTGTNLTLSGGIATAGQALTIGSTANNGNITVSGALSGSGSLTKAGSGALTFSGTTGTVGATHLNAGTISVATGSTLNTGAFDSAVSTTLIIASGGTVVANYASGSTTFSGAMSGSGNFQKTGAGTLVFDHTFSAPNLTLTLSGGTLSILGGGYTFGTIHITGNTVLDFNNSAGTFLSSASLIIDAGVTVTVNNWASIANNASLSTVWYATNTINGGTLGGVDLKGGTPLTQIVFTNYNGLTTTWVSGAHDGWFDHEIRPTPEPSTYGAIFASGCLGLLGWRRYRRIRAAKV